MKTIEKKVVKSKKTIIKGSVFASAFGLLNQEVMKNYDWKKVLNREELWQR